MKRLTVLEYPAPSLKKASKEINEFGQAWLKELVDNLFETMRAEEGLGLAAPQVGENVALFVMDVGRVDPLDPSRRIPDPIYMINPKLIFAEGVFPFEEGCLSCPDLAINLNRPNGIKIETYDLNGQIRHFELSEVASICTQHEMDHLQGKLLADHLSTIKREFYAKKQIRKLKSEKEFDKVKAKL